MNEKFYRSFEKAVTAESLNSHGQKYIQNKDYSNAIKIVSQAIHLYPQNSDLYITLGKAFFSTSQIDRAEQCFSKSISINPHNADSWYEHGKVSEYQKKYLHAESDYRKAISIDINHLGSIYKLALILFHSENYNDSIKLLKKAIKLQPKIALIHNSLGLAYKRINSYKESKICFENAIKYQPKMAEAYNNLGLIFEEEKKYDEASKYYRKAIKVNDKFAVAYYNLGKLLYDKGKVDEAIITFKKAILSKKYFSEAFNNLGIAFQYKGLHHRALNCFQISARFNLNNSSALYNSAILFQYNNQFKKAKLCIDRILSLSPNDSKVLIPYYQLLKDVCEWEKAAKIGQKIDVLTANALQSNKCPDEMPFLNIARCQDMKNNLAIAKSWSRKILSEIDKTLNIILGNRNNPNKISIGYLSDGFRNHPNTHLISDIFKFHDRKNFNIFCYSYGDNDNNPYRKKIEKECDKFIDLKDENDFSIAKRINNDGCDILVELKGFTFGSRLKICAFRPAPIQIRFLGSPGTTGAPFFDYLITDRTVTPEKYAKFYSEKFAYLPDCYQVNSIPHKSAIRSLSRIEVGLPVNAFVFCSFCASYKIDAEMFSVWMRILKRTPGSYLWLLKDTDEVVANIRKAAISKGIGDKRLIFADRCDREKHLNRLHCADLALDTSIVNGAITTSDALWSGVPVVTLKGKTFISRMSTSILKRVGLKELICTDTQEYEDTAVHFATHPIDIENIKAKINRKTLLETIYDTKSSVKNLERLYKKMWQTHLAGNPPAMIDTD